MQSLPISNPFIWRRVHSLMGFWIVLYLFLHLVTNSQAALWLNDSGSGFIRMVNSLESLPYLHVIEVILIGVPLGVHAIWGIHRALTARTNSVGFSGKKPSLPYERNFAFTLQRLSSWILLIGIIGHVVQMRFIDMPEKICYEGQEQFRVTIASDDNLESLAHRFSVQIEPQGDRHVTATADSPGPVMLLKVRDTFKSIWMCIFYTIFVLAAAFHAGNGFWTFLITWGIILSYAAQKKMVPVCLLGAALLAFLGLAAIWGS